MKAKCHDHRQSLWIIAGGRVIWCYRCGAWKYNYAVDVEKHPWNKPTGPNGENPALKLNYKKETQ